MPPRKKKAVAAEAEEKPIATTDAGLGDAEAAPTEERKSKRGRGSTKKTEASEEKKVEEKTEKEEEDKPEERELKKGKRKATKELDPPPVTDIVLPPSSSSSSSDPSTWSFPYETLMYFETPGVKHSAKLATFDYDGCLANTSLFKKGPDAWSLLFPDIPQKLKTLHDNGYKLVIFTNQSDIGKAAKPETREKAILEKRGRLEGFVNLVGLPFQIYVATVKNHTPDPFRKPAGGMWKELIQNRNGGIAPDMERSFFVGDAAGRKKDHSDTDKAFAEALGLKFFTEDVFFKSFPSDLITS